MSVDDEIEATTNYEAYGNPTTKEGLSSYTPFGFSGSYTDTTGLIYLINRYYDPLKGQFISVDPLVAQTGQPYSYTGGDPVNGVDPSGMCPYSLEVCPGLPQYQYSPPTTIALKGPSNLLTLASRVRYAYDYFTARGLDAYQTAGILGNLEYESGGNLNPAQWQFGCTVAGCGRGIAQWTVDASRWQNLVILAGKMHMSPLNYQVQVAFVWQELQSDYYSSTYLPLKASTTIQKAVSIIELFYDVPASPSQSYGQRLADAQNILTEMATTQRAKAIIQCG